MLGAIIGDIVGSRFEFNNHRSKDFELFTDNCFVTDDSIMTLAVAKAIMEAEKIREPLLSDYGYDFEYYSVIESMTIKHMQEIARRYPNCGYGGRFNRWVFCDKPQPYNSYGNGAAMRISPVSFAARTESELCNLSTAVTGVTHNHPEGYKGAEATAVAIYMARCGFTKIEIRNRIHRDYYTLDFRIDHIRNTYKFNETCQETVPQAIEAFLESSSFEDAIRISISLGGDSDTLAAITGAIAEAYYGVPIELKEKALSYLDYDLRRIYDEWTDFIGCDSNSDKFKVLTKYINKFPNDIPLGVWIIDKENNGTLEHPIQLPFVYFNELVDLFVQEFYGFSEVHPEYELTGYASILESNGLHWDDEQMRSVDLDQMSEKCVLALIMGAIRAERFCDGALLGFFEDGLIIKWLTHLKKNKNEHKPKQVVEIYFEIGGYAGYDTYQIVFGDSASQLMIKTWSDEPIQKKYSIEEARKILCSFHKICVDDWNNDYIDPSICDGEQWKLVVKYRGERAAMWEGSNEYPANFKKLLFFFKRLSKK